MAPRSAAVYARISRDRHGDLLGVDRQEKACRALIERQGWTLSGVFVDDDRSAYSGKRRPAYDRLMADVASGAVGTIVALHTDRLHRRPVELEEFISLVEATGCHVETVQAGRLDLSTRSGRTTARLLGTVARDECEAKSERLKAKHAELVGRGRWSGGPRPYGYRPDGAGSLRVDAEEAAVVREAAARVLAGETAYGIVQDLNGRSVPTVKGGPWRPPTLRRILTGWTWVGRREHKGEDAGPAVWDPILDPADHRRLRALILDPARARETPARVALLSGGLARCGRCGTALLTQRRQSGARVYCCVRNAGGCGALSIQAEPLEDVLSRAICRAVDGPALAAAVTAPGTGTDADGVVAATKDRMAELADMFAVGEIGRAEWIRARGPLDAAVRAAEARVAADSRRSALAPWAGRGGSLRAAWPTMTLAARRSVIAAAVRWVDVQPATRRGRVFDPERVDPKWIDAL